VLSRRDPANDPVSELGEALVIPPSTAERHVANILNKLGMRSRTDVALWARDHGFGENRTMMSASGA
jgi:hypothetical protein